VEEIVKYVAVRIILIPVVVITEDVVIDAMILSYQ